jgi:ribosomal protein S18 acetylase RimI-like enzyme
MKGVRTMCFDSNYELQEQHLKKISEASEEDLSKLAELYCQIWKEPPWYEDFWTPAKALEDLSSQMAKANAIGYLAIDDYIQGKIGILGFSWGYQVTKREMQDISGGEGLDFLFSENRNIFYVDELGVSSNSRRKGVGKWLTIKVLSDAQSKGNSIAILRTEKEAYAARRLYGKIGFRDLLIKDVKYPGRTYLSLAL